MPAFLQLFKIVKSAEGQKKAGLAFPGGIARDAVGEQEHFGIMTP